MDVLLFFGGVSTPTGSPPLCLLSTSLCCLLVCLTFFPASSALSFIAHLSQTGVLLFFSGVLASSGQPPSCAFSSPSSSCILVSLTLFLASLALFSFARLSQT